MVLLRHELPDGSWHFDWMLERPPWGEVRKSSEDRCLATWRVMERVDRLRAAGTRVAGETLADHRRVYLWHDGAVGGEVAGMELFTGWLKARLAGGGSSPIAACWWCAGGDRRRRAVRRHRVIPGRA
jgi:hypothetical protein